MLGDGDGGREITYTAFSKQLEAGRIKTVTITETGMNGEFTVPVDFGDGLPFTQFQVQMTGIDAEYADKLVAKGVEVRREEGEGLLLTLLISLGPVILIVVLFVFMMRRMQGQGNQAMKFAKSRAKLVNQDKNKTTFDDVAGCDEAKEELSEIIDFLRSPKRFQKLGGKIPKGVLLVGSPGTGKTLLARAVAGEASVPFFSIAGSDFVEMFVGVGAARVRDLFNTGKRNAPCILFIDEIDAVGRQRGAGLGGGHDEREQTLNQLLTEMDGFESESTIILMAATNRPDVLDPALLRPGRFDRRVVVDMPDIIGRYEILKVHVQEKPLADNVDLQKIARGTHFFSGADLANLVNEAAILAARYDQSEITHEIFEAARDKVMMGPERHSRRMDEDSKEQIAYHEAGHALVTSLLPDYDPVHKVTIIPRGMALGLTMPLPEKERYTYDKDYLEKQLQSLLGGRAAEEVVFDKPTTGASNDIERASSIARKMVCEWGMSEKLGPLSFGKKGEEIFLGREISQHHDYSEDTARLIDAEVRAIIETAHQRAKKLLVDNRDKLDRLAKVLLERETIDNDEIAAIINDSELPPDDRTLPDLRELAIKRREERRKNRPVKTDAAVWPGDEGEKAEDLPLGTAPKSED
ncbi:ATP-dependent zinc metalloprotease FtsH [bacterium]|nr:ATP-dependent zinc metalloprotease FtsH [bacterium]